MKKNVTAQPKANKKGGTRGFACLVGAKKSLLAEIQGINNNKGINPAKRN